MRLRVCFAAAVLTLAGCSAKIVRVDMDATRLAPTAANTVHLACSYRLGQLADARPAGSQAGGLSGNAFEFADAVGVVRRQLLAAGLQDTGNPAPVVAVRIMQLYLAQNLLTKVPVAVYEVAVADRPPFLLRSQKASMNWNGSQDEAYAAYALALADVNQQLIARLNTDCAKG
jgi:hypothetical protein